MLGTHLSEFHSGYRPYSTEALKKIPFDRNTQDFHFDTQIIIQFHAAGLRIVERPIPTYYGDEICHVNGMTYAKDVVASVMRCEAHEQELDAYYEANLFAGLPDEILDERFDTILFADVLEHLPNPDAMLSQAAGLLNENGKILASVPNAVHWNVRAQVAAGRFDYTNKGIMDHGHLRFFTKMSAERMFELDAVITAKRMSSSLP